MDGLKAKRFRGFVDWLRWYARGGVHALECTHVLSRFWLAVRHIAAATTASKGRGLLTQKLSFHFAFDRHVPGCTEVLTLRRRLAREARLGDWAVCTFVTSGLHKSPAGLTWRVGDEGCIWRVGGSLRSGEEY